MKKLSFFLLVIGVVACAQNSSKKQEPQPAKQQEPKPEKQYEYSLHHRFGSFDYQIFVNDILIAQSSESNGIPGPYDLNPYIFRDGEQKIRIKLIAPESLGYESFTYADIENFKKETAISLLIDRDFDHMEIVKHLEFSDFERDTSEITQEWTFEAKAVPGTTDLNNSEDLSEMDPDELQKEVVQKYTELRMLLNKGKVSAMMKEIQKAMQNVFLTGYMDASEQKEYKTNAEKYFKNAWTCFLICRKNEPGILPERNLIRRKAAIG